MHSVIFKVTPLSQKVLGSSQPLCMQGKGLPRLFLPQTPLTWELPALGLSCPPFSIWRVSFRDYRWSPSNPTGRLVLLEGIFHYFFLHLLVTYHCQLHCFVSHTDVIWQPRHDGWKVENTSISLYSEHIMDAQQNNILYTLFLVANTNNSRAPLLSWVLFVDNRSGCNSHFLWQSWICFDCNELKSCDDS